MKAVDLSSENRTTLLTIRNQLAEEGTEITPDQYIENVVELDEISKEVGIDLIELRTYVSLYDQTPPLPPYKAGFDDEKEALEFKERAEKTHNIKLELIKKDRIYYLVL